MTLPSPPFIPDSALEQRALRLLQEYERQKGKSLSLPVPIEKIIEQVLNLDIVWLPIEEGPSDIILARIDPHYGARPAIQLNLLRRPHFEQYFGTEAFSLAHECAHWVLHYDRGRSKQLALSDMARPEVQMPLLCRQLSAGDRRELQAERFAAYLLMPEHLILHLSAGHDLTSERAVSNLARRCGVSKRALVRRLAELRLVSLGADGRLSRPVTLTADPRLC